MAVPTGLSPGVDALAPYQGPMTDPITRSEYWGQRSEDVRFPYPRTGFWQPPAQNDVAPFNQLDQWRRHPVGDLYKSLPYDYQDQSDVDDTGAFIGSEPTPVQDGFGNWLRSFSNLFNPISPAGADVFQSPRIAVKPIDQEVEIRKLLDASKREASGNQTIVDRLRSWGSGYTPMERLFNPIDVSPQTLTGNEDWNWADEAMREIEKRRLPEGALRSTTPRGTGSFFGDLLSKAMSTAQASVSPTLPPRYVLPPVIEGQQEDLQNRRDQFDKFNPLGVDYEAPPYDPSWNEAAKIPYIRPGLPGRHPEVSTPLASVLQPIVETPVVAGPRGMAPRIPPQPEPEPAMESAKDKAAREAREQRSAEKKQAQADTKKAVERAVKKSTASKPVKKVVTSKKNIADAVAAARGDVKSAVTIALTSGAAQRAAAKASGVDPSTVYGSTLRRTAGGRWAGGF